MKKTILAVCLTAWFSCTPFPLDNPEFSLSKSERALIGISDYWSFEKGNESLTGSGNRLEGDYQEQDGGPSGKYVRLLGASLTEDSQWLKATKPAFSYVGGTPYEYTLAFWIKVDSAPSSVPLFSDRAKGGTDYSLEVQLSGTSVTAYADSGNSGVNPPNLITIGFWEFLAVTVSMAGEVRIYHASESSSPLTLAYNSVGIANYRRANKPFTMACRLNETTGDRQDMMTGGASISIAEPMLFDRCLPLADLTLIMNR